MWSEASLGRRAAWPAGLEGLEGLEARESTWRRHEPRPAPIPLQRAPRLAKHTLAQQAAGPAGPAGTESVRDARALLTQNTIAE